MPQVRRDVRSMNMSQSFLDCVRDADWQAAINLVQQGDVPSAIFEPRASLFSKLVDLNAPADLIVSLLDSLIRREALEAEKLGLLAQCMNASASKSNAFATFSALLAYGLTPNCWVIGKGSTLLQEAMELNKVREVEVMMRYGPDPHQMSVFGPESTSNVDEAMRIKNAAATVALCAFKS